jgi:hypothetical protein
MPGTATLGESRDDATLTKPTHGFERHQFRIARSNADHQEPAGAAHS